MTVASTRSVECVGSSPVTNSSTASKNGPQSPAKNNRSAPGSCTSAPVNVLGDVLREP